MAAHCVPFKTTDRSGAVRPSPQVLCREEDFPTQIGQTHTRNRKERQKSEMVALVLTLEGIPHWRKIGSAE